MMKMSKVLAVLGLLSVLACSQSGATLLNLTWADDGNAPDFFSSGISVAYDASSQTFQAIGQTQLYSNGSESLNDFGTFTLTATITHAGLLTNGTLTVEGDLGSGQETLLTGNLNTGADGTAFGSAALTSSSGRFEFLFTVTGGESTVVTDFGGSGSPNGGVILSAPFGNGDTPFTGSWTSSFSDSHNQSAESDTSVVVPEPSSILLLLLGGLACLFAQRAGINGRLFSTLIKP